MKNLVLFVALFVTSAAANAQFYWRELSKHPEVKKLVNQIQLRQQECGSAHQIVLTGTRTFSLDHPLIKDHYSKLTLCTDGPTEEERASFSQAMAVLDTKPQARTALKGYFLRWGEFLRDLKGVEYESARLLTAKVDASSKKLNDALAELVLELNI